MADGTTEEGYRGPQVCSLVGITYRQLDYWARTDLLRPSITEAKGSGTQRRYSYQDLLELKVIKGLLDAGISLESARRAIGSLRENLGEDVASANLVLTGTESVLATSGEEIVDLLPGGQGVLNILPPAGVQGARGPARPLLRGRRGGRGRPRRAGRAAGGERELTAVADQVAEPTPA